MLPIGVEDEPTTRVGCWAYEKLLVASRKFKVTLLACDFSKLMLKSSIDMQMLSRTVFSSKCSI